MFCAYVKCIIMRKSFTLWQCVIFHLLSWFLSFSTDVYIVCLQCRNRYTHITQYSPPGGQTHTRKLSRAQFNILAICTHGLLNNLLFLYDFIVAQVQLRKHKTTRKKIDSERVKSYVIIVVALSQPVVCMASLIKI